MTGQILSYHYYNGKREIHIQKRDRDNKGVVSSLLVFWFVLVVHQQFDGSRGFMTCNDGMCQVLRVQLG